MSPISNNIVNFVTYMTKNDALGPIVALEATVTGGRTVQAYKRGGEDEARERLIEESTGAIVWLGGVRVLNNIGDMCLKKLFGGNFDVGTDDVLRTPFKNFMKKQPPKKFTAKQVAMIKASKVLTSIVLADAFIGLVVPPINQALTRNIIAKKKLDKDIENDKLPILNKGNKQQSNKVSFKGLNLNAINTFTNAIENTNTGKLLSTDAGLVTGRTYSARNNDERREIAIRDITSIYFYMWAQGHVCNLLNLLEMGSTSRLNPTTTGILEKHIEKVLASKGGEMSVEEFKKMMLGQKDTDIKLPEGIKFETGKLSAFNKISNKFGKNKVEPLKVAKVSDLEKIITDKNLLSRIKEMSTLQPLRLGEAVITKQQIIDAINVAEINNPELLHNVFNEFTGGKFDKTKNKYVGGASEDPYKYVSNSSLYNLKDKMKHYVERACKNSKDGKINIEYLKKMQNKNLMLNGLNFIAGFAVASAFLSTLIPKFQYWVTKQKTGRDEFPGTEDLIDRKEDNLNKVV